MDESAQSLDENLLAFMDQLELLEEKRIRLNSLIEQVGTKRQHCLYIIVQTL